MSHCAVCLRDFVRGLAKTKHELACTDPPPNHEELVKMVYKLTRKLDDLSKEFNDYKRSRGDGTPIKDKPGPFPEFNEMDLWNFFLKGLDFLIDNKEWPVYWDGRRLMMYKSVCRKTNEEGWEEVSPDELDTLKRKIYTGLQRVFNENADKITQSREYENIEIFLNKLSAFTPKNVSDAFQKKHTDSFVPAEK